MYGIIGAVLMAVVLRLAHVIKRKLQMRCSCGRFWGVKKICKMISLGDLRFEVYIFGACECERVRFIRSEDKKFTNEQIARRKRKSPEQFDNDPDLFIKSGLVSPEGTTPFMFNLLHAREEHKRGRLDMMIQRRV